MSSRRTQLISDIENAGARDQSRWSKSWYVSSEPDDEPVYVTDVKSHARIDISDDDFYISTLITAARKHIERMLNLAFITQTQVHYFERFPEDDAPIVLGVHPVQSITSIAYVDENGASQTWGASNYQSDLRRTPPVIRPAYNVSYPSTRDDTLQAVTVTLSCGFGADGDYVPADLKLALLQTVAHWYERRESVEMAIGGMLVEVPRLTRFILQPYKLRFLG